MKSDQGIIWLASYPKSGNTWLRVLLSAYLYGEWRDFGSLRVGFSDIPRWAYQAVSPLSFGELTLPDELMIRPAALAHVVAAREGTSPVFLKTHFANVIVNDQRVIPVSMTRGAFYVVRDPRAVVPSYANHFDISHEEAVKALAEERRYIVREGHPHHFVSSWSLHTHSWLSEDKFPVVLIKYERLQEDPHGVLRGVLRRLNFEIDEGKIERAVETTEFSKLKALEEAEGFHESISGRTFFRDGGRTHWQDALSPELADQVVSDHWRMMHELGYIDDDTAASKDRDDCRWDGDREPAGDSTSGPPQWEASREDFQSRGASGGRYTSEEEGAHCGAGGSAFVRRADSRGAPLRNDDAGHLL